MPTAATARPLSPPPVRRLGRRLLGSGLLEALAAPHGVDRYLELVRPSWSLHEARAEVIEVRRQTADSVTLTLRPNENWKGFRTGQFVRLTVEIDGVRHTRCYSPACSEHAPDRIEITVKAHPEGLVSGFLNRAARPGMVVGLSAADGDFVLPADRPERLLLISGGSGITPVISMLRTLCDEGHAGAVTFVHYAPTRDRRPLPHASSARSQRVIRTCGSSMPTRARPAAPSPATSAASTCDAVAPDRAARRDLRLRPARADRVGAQDLGRGRHRAAAPRRELPPAFPRDRRATAPRAA